MLRGDPGTCMRERGLCQAFWPCVDSSRHLVHSLVFPFGSEYPGAWDIVRQSDRTQPTPFSSPPPAALVGGEGSRLDQLQYDVRKGSVVNVNPTNTRAHSETPEIRKYKKRFNSEILCAALWGKPGWGRKRGAWCAPVLPVRRGPGSASHLPKGSSCRGQPAGGHGEWADVAGPQRAGQGVWTHRPAALPAKGRAGGTQLAHHHLRLGGGGGQEEGSVPGGRAQSCSPGQNWKMGAPLSHPSRSTQDGGEVEAGPSVRVLCPSGKRNKLRVYYLSWLRNKILHNDPEVEKKQGWTTVGDMEGCGHYRVGEEVTTQRPGHICL